MEDVMHVLKMSEGSRAAGRKPKGYRPIRTLDEVKRWVVEDAQDSADGVKTEG